MKIKGSSTHQPQDCKFGFSKPRLKVISAVFALQRFSFAKNSKTEYRNHQHRKEIEKKERSLIRKKLLTATLLLVVFVFAFSGSVLANEFTDTENHWAKHSIDYVTDQEYFFGTTSTVFSPDMSMTRAMFVTVISRMSGEDMSRYSRTVFTDVKRSDYYYTAVNWAYKNGIVAGMGDGKFSPEEFVTREQICLILMNYLDYLGRDSEIRNDMAKYSDNAAISGWAYDSVYKMQEYGFLIGDSQNMFRPAACASRAECASVFSRLDGRFFNNYIEGAEPDDKDNEAEEDTFLPDDDSLTLVGDFKSTFYCPGSCCNSEWAGKTATGEVPTPGVTIAVDSSLIPLGSKVYIEFEEASLQHLNGIYIAQDTGGAIKGYKIDVLVESHALALSLGVGNAKVYMVSE